MRGLAPVPGRKLCLLVSDGFLVGTGTSEERTKDLRAIIDAGTRSGTVVYAIDSHGLVGNVGDAATGQVVASAPGLQTTVDRTTMQLFRMTLECRSRPTPAVPGLRHERVRHGRQEDAGRERQLLPDGLRAREPQARRQVPQDRGQGGASRRLRRAHACRLPRARRQQARGEDGGGAASAGRPRPGRAGSTRPRRARSSTPRAPRRRCR